MQILEKSEKNKMEDQFDFLARAEEKTVFSFSNKNDFINRKKEKKNKQLMSQRLFFRICSLSPSRKFYM